MANAFATYDVAFNIFRFIWFAFHGHLHDKIQYEMENSCLYDKSTAFIVFINSVGITSPKGTSSWLIVKNDAIFAK